MDLRPVQYYATTLEDRYQKHQTLSFLFIPARSLKDGKVPDSLNEVSQALGSPTRPKDLSPFQVPLALASLLQPAGLDQSSWTDPQSGASISIDPRALGFAEFVAFSEVVPFEASDLKGYSPLAIAALAGAKIGLLAGGAFPSPVLLITVPAGILFCSAAVILGAHVGNAIGGLLGG